MGIFKENKERLSFLRFPVISRGKRVRKRKTEQMERKSSLTSTRGLSPGRMEKEEGKEGGERDTGRETQ